MTLKLIYAYLATPWHRIGPLKPQHRSREAWIEWCKAHNRSPDGTEPKP